MVFKKVSIVYRRKFAIESSYRIRNIIEPKTSSKMLISDIFIRYIFSPKKHMAMYSEKHFTIVKGDPHIVDEDKFIFDTFIILID